MDKEPSERYPAFRKPKRELPVAAVDPNVTPLSEAEMCRRLELDEIIDRSKEHGVAFISACMELEDKQLCRDLIGGTETHLRNRHQISRAHFYELRKQSAIAGEIGRTPDFRETRAISQIQTLTGESAAIVDELVRETTPVDDATGEHAKPTVEDYQGIRDILVGIKETGGLELDGKNISLRDAIDYMKNEGENERRKRLSQENFEERRTLKDKLARPQHSEDVPKRHRGGNEVTFRCSGKGHGNVALESMPKGQLIFTCGCAYRFLSTGELVNWIETPAEPQKVARKK